MSSPLVQLPRAVVKTVVARARRGPLHPAWNLTFESVMAVLQATPPLVSEARIRARRAEMERMPALSAAALRVRRSVVTDAGVPITVFAPRRRLSGPTAVLYLHGGYYTVGSPRSHREIGSRLAEHVRARVFMPDYRLAPEHPFPAALDDALACYRWLLGRTSARDLLLAGDSAGGGLAVALMVATREAGLPLPAAAALISPWVDLRCRGDAFDRLAAFDFIGREELAFCARAYAGTLPLEDPRLSPLNASLVGLPPLLIQVGGLEVLRDDIATFAAHARAAGVQVTLDESPTLPHVPPLLASVSRSGREAERRLAAFLRVRTGS